MRVMMMARCAGIVLAATFLGVGAAPEAGARTGQASVQSVIQAFADAVHAYCVPSIMTGTPLADLSPDGRPQSLELATSNRGLTAAATVWAISGIGEIVTLQEEQEYRLCRVSAYGPPVAPVFEALGRALALPDLAFVEVETGRPPVPRTVVRKFESRVDDVLYTVVLSGNEPGAPGRMSRFSTLMATVSARLIGQEAEIGAAGEE